MKTYSQYVADFQDAVTDSGMFEYAGGLNYVFRHAFSAIPAAVGHFIDTLFGLDGLIGRKEDGSRDRESHMGGPFGLLLGLPFFIAGAIVGQILQIVLSIPATIACYLLDKPLSFLITNFDKGVTALEVPVLSQISGAIAGDYVTLTKQPPPKMSGPFGFLFGLIPHLVSYIFIRMGATFNSLIQFGTDGICLGIRTVYEKIGNAIFGETKAENTDSLEPEASKPHRLKAPPGRGHMEGVQLDSDMEQIKKDKVDLFAILELSLSEYEQDPSAVHTQYKKVALKYHPDKSTGQEENFDRLTKANEILSDPNSPKAIEYIKWYKLNFRDDRPSSQAGHKASMFGGSASTSSEEQPSDISPKRKLGRKHKTIDSG